MSATRTQEGLPLFVTPAHECRYLPGRTMTNVFVAPSHPGSPGLYAMLLRHGFRRSGEHVYRPACGACRACVPVRIPVQEFRPRRSQRRAWRCNRTLRVSERDLRFREEHFDLYRRYLTHRHHGGGMDDPTPGQYLEFLGGRWTDVVFFEFREGPRLLAVAVADRLPGALSAVYSFFDPDFESRSLGVYCVLWQIEAARRSGREWLYLGYWIAGCRKMQYKDRYLPQERLIEGTWVRCTDPARSPFIGEDLGRRNAPIP